MLHDLLRLPRRMLAFFAAAPELIAASKRSAKLAAAVEKRLSRLEKEVTAIDRSVRGGAADSRSLRKDLNDRFLQYNLQLGRLSRNRDGAASEEPRLSWRSVPLALDTEPVVTWEGVGEGAPAPDAEGREWLTLDACPACGTADHTVVNPFNKLILLDKAPDATAASYGYAICHGCGLMFATRRPCGERYRSLLANFGEVTGKAGDGGHIKNPLLNPYPLSADDRRRLTQLASRGVWVSDHAGVPRSDYLDGLLKDRFENSVHLDLLGALVNPRGARVLEIRPRAGTISEGLRRLFGADVHAMPIWESQALLLREVYGIESRGLIDYDQFEIPFDGRFDLIVCNHMFTHAVRPAQFFDAIARHLAPGGHVYFYNEPDDAEFLQGSQSMLATLNPLHMQAFDQASLVRALAARGLEVVFLKRRNLNHMCLARAGAGSWTPMTPQERASRLQAYQRAYDRAVLSVPPPLRARFAAEWPQVVERGVAAGIAEFDADGHLRLVGRHTRN
jgi:SAM-dependent methyltransferase